MDGIYSMPSRLPSTVNLHLLTPACTLCNPCCTSGTLTRSDTPSFPPQFRRTMCNLVFLSARPHVYKVCMRRGILGRRSASGSGSGSSRDTGTGTGTGRVVRLDQLHSTIPLTTPCSWTSSMLLRALYSDAYLGVCLGLGIWFVLGL